VFEIDVYTFPGSNWILDAPRLNLEQIVTKYKIDHMIIPAWDRDGISDIVSSWQSNAHLNIWGEPQSTPCRFYLLGNDLAHTRLYLRLYGPGYAQGVRQVIENIGIIRIATWLRDEQRWLLG
jgi:hypothetical protein